MNRFKYSTLRLTGVATLLFALVIVLQPMQARALVFTPIFACGAFDNACENEATQERECEAQTNTTQTATWNATTNNCDVQVNNIMTLAQYDAAHPPTAPQTTTATVTSATTTDVTNTATTTTVSGQQSQIVELLKQLIALETQLLQLQSGQSK